LTLKTISDNKLRIAVAESLKGLMSRKTSAEWGLTDAAGRWQALATVADPANSPDYRTELTSFLETLSCKARWAAGSVAEGVARRATGRQFRGDLPAIYLRLNSQEDCKPGQSVDKVLMQELASSVDARIGQ